MEKLGKEAQKQGGEVVAMVDWIYEGDEREGVIVGGSGERYPCRLERGQVQVHLPFAVDRDRLRDLLRGDGWAVAPAHERIDSQGWGPVHDVEGYYPYWLHSAPEGDGTILAFPPQDYRVGEGRITHTEGAARSADAAAEGSPGRQHQGGLRGKGSEPVIGPEALEQFARWIPYVKAARRAGEG